VKLPPEEPAPIGEQALELKSDIVATVLALVNLAWQHACTSSEVHSDAAEVPMTEKLRDGMRLESDKWGRPVLVLQGAESRSTPEVTVPDGRTDIPLMVIEIIVSGGATHDPHAIIECKRIAGSDAYLCREYVVQGIDRFISGKYGASHGVGFMAGYVLSGTPDEAADGVNASLLRAKRTADVLTKSAPDAWDSGHSRSAPMAPIRLHHAFLPTPVAA
jgi:hypothetical protein